MNLGCYCFCKWPLCEMVYNQSTGIGNKSARPAESIRRHGDRRREDVRRRRDSPHRRSSASNLLRSPGSSYLATAWRADYRLPRDDRVAGGHAGVAQRITLKRGNQRRRTCASTSLQPRHDSGASQRSAKVGDGKPPLTRPASGGSRGDRSVRPLIPASMRRRFVGGRGGGLAGRWWVWNTCSSCR